MVRHKLRSYVTATSIAISIGAATSIAIRTGTDTSIAISIGTATSVAILTNSIVPTYDNIKTGLFFKISRKTSYRLNAYHVGTSIFIYTVVKITA